MKREPVAELGAEGYRIVRRTHDLELAEKLMREALSQDIGRPYDGDLGGVGEGLDSHRAVPAEHLRLRRGLEVRVPERDAELPWRVPGGGVVVITFLLSIAAWLVASLAVARLLGPVLARRGAELGWPTEPTRRLTFDQSMDLIEARYSRAIEELGDE